MTKHHPIIVNGKKVGQVFKDVFYKELRQSKHFLRKPPAIAFDINSVEQAKQLGAKHIMIKDTENILIFRASIKQLELDGFKFDRGHGEQIALGLEKWSRHCQVCLGKDYIIKGVDCGC